MKKRPLILLTIASITLATAAQAQVIYEEHFGGSNGDLDGQLGWTQGPSSDQIDIQGVGVFSLGVPTDYSSDVVVNNFQGVARGISVDVVPNGDPNPFVAGLYTETNALNGIDFDADGEVYWFSFSASNVFGGSYENDLIITNGSFTTQLRLGFRDDGVAGGAGLFGVQAGATGTTADANGGGGVTFVLGRITTATGGGSDLIEFRTYSTTDAIGQEADWTPEATASGVITGAASHLQLRMAAFFNPDGNDSQMDRIIFGNTFTDVTGIVAQQVNAGFGYLSVTPGGGEVVLDFQVETTTDLANAFSTVGDVTVEEPTPGTVRVRFNTAEPQLFLRIKAPE